MFEGLSILEILNKGGIAVYVLSLLSVLSVAVAIERFFAFKGFNEDFLLSLEGDTKEENEKDNEKGTGASGEGSFKYLFYNLPVDKGDQETLRVLQVRARFVLSVLDKNLSVLATIGSIAPFIGLFGTVLGIIRAFNDLAIEDAQSVAMISDGIAEALVATAAGLFVAIPAVIFYNYFLRRRKTMAIVFESKVSEAVSPMLSGK